MQFSSADLEFLYIISAISAGLSILGNLSIFILYLLIKPLHLYAFRLVLYISICDTIRSLPLIYPIHQYPNSSLCAAFGYLFAFSAISGVMWVLAIAFSLTQILIKKNHHIERYHTCWFFLATVLPAFITTLPFLTDSYGMSAGWCTIKEDKISAQWKLYLFYVPTWTIILCLIGFYMWIGWNLYRNPEVNDMLSERHSLIQRIIAYPVIMVLSFLPISCVRMIYLTKGTGNIYAMAFAYFCYGSYGFFNSIAYGYNDIVKVHIREKLFSSSQQSLMSL